MKKLIAFVLSVLPALALATTWTNVPLVDHNCAGKFSKDPDKHETSCLLTCASSGYGILENGKWVELDKAGNEKALAALKATSRKDHIRVNVTGEQEGSVIHVKSLTIPE
jgi:hypothetical protein